VGDGSVDAVQEGEETVEKGRDQDADKMAHTYFRREVSCDDADAGQAPRQADMAGSMSAGHRVPDHVSASAQGRRPARGGAVPAVREEAEEGVGPS